MVPGSCFNFEIKNGPNGKKEIFLCEILNVNHELITISTGNSKTVNDYINKNLNKNENEYEKKDKNKENSDVNKKKYVEESENLNYDANVQMRQEKIDRGKRNLNAQSIVESANKKHNSHLAEGY